MALPVIWYREEFKDKDDLLETREEFDIRRGLAKGAMQSRFYAYGDRLPEIVKKVGHAKYYLSTELDAFFDSIKGHDQPRTPAERLAADRARRQETVKDHQGRVAKKKAELEKAERQLAVHEAKLRSVEIELKLYTG